MVEPDETKIRSEESIQDRAVESSERIAPAELEVVPFRDPALLTQFLHEPLPKIAAAVTGALTIGRSDAILMGGRVVQAAIKGRAFQQVSREIQALIEKGQIKEDYANSEDGFKSLEELLMFIDEEVPQEERIKAVKAMFIAINSVEAKASDKMLKYALLQIAKKLSASQLMLLKISYDFYKAGTLKTDGVTDFARWSALVAQKFGHGVAGLVVQDNAALELHGLLTPRSFSDLSGIMNHNARLTDLAVKFCQYIEKYGE
jgi:hypothetical protein